MLKQLLINKKIIIYKIKIINLVIWMKFSVKLNSLRSCTSRESVKTKHRSIVCQVKGLVFFLPITRFILVNFVSHPLLVGAEMAAKGEEPLIRKRILFAGRQSVAEFLPGSKVRRFLCFFFISFQNSPFHTFPKCSLQSLFFLQSCLFHQKLSNAAHSFIPSQPYEKT